MKHKIKIQKFHFAGIPVKAYQLKGFQGREILEFIDKNAGLFDNALSLKDCFHNKKSTYSKIQLSSEWGELALTAYGKDEINAVKQWWRHYKKQHKGRLYMQTTEKYVLQILPEPKKYVVNNLLINRKKYERLQELKNEPEKFKAELEKYLMANLLPLFNLVGYWHDKEKNDLKPKISYYKEHQKKFKVYHDYYRNGFKIVFETRLLLPHLFRMGESTALGYGTIKWRH